MKEIKENCGLFGVYNAEDASELTFLGLYALQHRGEESCGITTFDGREFYTHKGMGLVSDVFNGEEVRKLPGTQAIGHVRYSTTGSSIERNVQPLFITSQKKGGLSLAHNGNLINTIELRTLLENKGTIFYTSSDSEIILHLMMQSKKDTLLDMLLTAVKKIRGAFALVLMDKDSIVGVRDPQGFRPLSIGKKGDAYFLSSETCAFDIVEASFVREVEPGEIVIINKDGINSYRYTEKKKRLGFCAFEFIYFSRPDSYIFGENVHTVREDMGRQLAKESPVDADIVIGMPDSGTSAALGFSKESGIPIELGIIRNHYVGRTFIQPYQNLRERSTKLKFNLIKSVINGKRIVVVDDSIVRGTTARTRVRFFKEAGAKEVHIRISSPPTKFGCYYGIDFPDEGKLIAHNMSVKEIENFLEVDSLAYISIEGMFKVLKYPKNHYCIACWNGDYPVKVKNQFKDKHLLEK